MEQGTCEYLESYGHEYWECSECQAFYVFDQCGIEENHPKVHNYNFCPNCGRKIVEYILYEWDESKEE